VNHLGCLNKGNIGMFPKYELDTWEVQGLPNNSKEVVQGGIKKEDPS
jgi:hypothetical protein